MSMWQWLSTTETRVNSYLFSMTLAFGHTTAAYVCDTITSRNGLTLWMAL